MKRIVIAVIALAAATPADAFWLDSFYCYLETRREENNKWPEQYVGQDRMNAAAPFDVMIRNGWRKQNLLGGHHFNEDCTKLSRAGELRVQWILTQAPQQHRQLFIERSLDQTITDQRVETANQFAAKVVQEGFATPAQDTHILSDGRPATTVDFVNTQFRENMMTPALPEASAPAITE